MPPWPLRCGHHLTVPPPGGRGWLWLVSGGKGGDGVLPFGDERNGSQLGRKKKNVFCSGGCAMGIGGLGCGWVIDVGGDAKMRLWSAGWWCPQHDCIPTSCVGHEDIPGHLLLHPHPLQYR